MTSSGMTVILSSTKWTNVCRSKMEIFVYRHRPRTSYNKDDLSLRNEPKYGSRQILQSFLSVAVCCGRLRTIIFDGSRLIECLFRSISKHT
jgi:hypothetical protein